MLRPLYMTGREVKQRLPRLSPSPSCPLPSPGSASADPLPSLPYSACAGPDPAATYPPPPCPPPHYAGPGPVPRLDGLNIPFGRVLEGMGVVGAITNVPTFRANERTSALNLLAGQLGDDRAAGVRRKYGRPLTAVIILKAGELPLEQEAA